MSVVVTTVPGIVVSGIIKKKYIAPMITRRNSAALLILVGGIVPQSLVSVEGIVPHC